jgi:hypothetical protein
MSMDEPAQSVRIAPGSASVTRMPSGATSWRSTLENPSTANLADW